MRMNLNANGNANIYGNNGQVRIDVREDYPNNQQVYINQPTGVYPDMNNSARQMNPNYGMNQQMYPPTTVIVQ